MMTHYDTVYIPSVCTSLKSKIVFLLSKFQKMARIIVINCLLLILSISSLSASIDHESISDDNFQDSMKIDLSGDQSNDENMQHSTQYDEKSETSIREDENEISAGTTIADYRQEAPMSGRFGPQSINRHHNDQYNWRATGLTMTSALIVIALFGIVLLVAFSVVNVLMDDPVPVLDEWGRQRAGGARYRSRSRWNFYNA